MNNFMGNFKWPLRSTKMKILLIGFILKILSINLAFGHWEHYPYNTIAKKNQITYYFAHERKNKSPLMVQLGVDTTFSATQKKIIEKSFEILLQRASAHHIIQCAFKSSYKNMPYSKAYLVSQIEEALSISTVNGISIPAFVFVAKFDGDDESVGLGYVNLFYDTDNPFPGQLYRHYLHFALNIDYLGKQKNYVYAHDFDYWAGVMGHEMLHNLGYIHPDGANGTFIQAYGHCIQNNGVEKMNTIDATIKNQLEDREIYKN